MNKIESINRAIEEYFSINKSVNKVPAKDLMSWFTKKGIFSKDHRKGFPIRNILRDLDRKNQLSKIPSAYPDRKAKNVYWYFIRLGVSVLSSSDKQRTVNKNKNQHSRNISNRSSRDEPYVIDLCDEALGIKASRQHYFDFLVGDPGKNGQCRKLPVDAYYESLSLVVEYRERQHTEEIVHFDKPDKTTVSGVHRGKQREIYDQRRRDVLPKHGIQLVEISYRDFNNDSGKKIDRNHDEDLSNIKKILNEKGYKHSAG